MARPNPDRTVTWETNAAARIKLERARRDWTLEALATRLTNAGCKIHGSAIQKIESGSRGLSFNEAMAFAEAFQIWPLEELGTPPGVVASEEAKKAWRDFTTAQERASVAFRECERALDKLLDLAYGEERAAILELAEGSFGEWLRVEAPVARHVVRGWGTSIERLVALRNLHKAEGRDNLVREADEALASLGVTEGLD